MAVDDNNKYYESFLKGDKNPSPFPLKLTPQLCFFPRHFQLHADLP